MTTITPSKIADGIKIIAYPILITIMIGFGKAFMEYGSQIVYEVKLLRIAITEQKKDIDYLKENDRDKEIRLRQVEITSFRKDQATK